MCIIATNRIKTECNIEVVINLHSKAFGKSVTISIYCEGMSSTLHLTPKEARDLQYAIDLTNREIDEETN